MTTVLPENKWNLPHDPNIWSQDRREILFAALVKDPDAPDDSPWTAEIAVFERFERCGEMSMIPYLRATVNGVTTEAPLAQWAYVGFSEDPLP